MSGEPIGVVDALLSGCVSLLFSTSRQNDFPEFYVRQLAHERLLARLSALRQGSERRVLFDPHHGMRILTGSVGASGPAPAAEFGTSELILLAGQQLSDAVDVLIGFGIEWAEDYIRWSAVSYMSGVLRQLRDQEAPSERDAFVSAVNRSRALVGQDPLDWEGIVTGFPLPVE
jgi:hypothetical protein